MEDDIITQPAEPTPLQGPKSGSKRLIVVLAVALIVVLGVIAVYAATQSTAPAQPTSQSVAQPTVAAATLEEEVNSVVVDDVDAEFSDIDRDLQSL